MSSSPTENTTTISFSDDHSTAKIVKWNVKSGSKISKGTILFSYELPEVTSNLKYKSSNVGTVLKILKDVDEWINKGDDVILLQNCLHPVVMKEMCAECGLDLKEINEAGQSYAASVAMVHSIPELKVSQEQAHIIGKADEQHLLATRKLALLVDLDQTLIHTTNDDIPPDIEDVFHFQLYGRQSPWYHTRFRPGTRQFLKNISNLYELHICTFGARPYAHMIAHLLDADGSLFSKRILSRDECFNPLSKTANLKALFPCGDSMVCIIDDREDVWNYAPNLVQVKPYHFFQHTGDINAPPSLAKNDEESAETMSNEQEKKLYHDEDDHLLHLEDKLRVIHRAYYEMYEQTKEEENKTIPDIKYVVPYVRRKVLKSVFIVFSGVIPTNMPAEKSRAWVVAKSLGAVIQNKLVGTNEEQATTHVIAARLGTQKVNEAKKLKNVHIVNPDWLWCCAERWEKVDEGLFPLVKTDSWTNKLMKENAASSQNGENEEKLKTKENQFSTTINPLLSFTSEDIAQMDQEVDDMICEGEEETSDDEESKDQKRTNKRKKIYSDSEESLSSDYPKGWSPKTKKTEQTAVPTVALRCDEDSALSAPSEKSGQSSDEYADSIGSVDEEMAAAVEREFLAP